MILLGRNIALNTLQHQGRSRENMSRSYYYLNHKNIKLNTIMKNFIAISSLLLLLCGCAISNSTHTFVHYGTDTLRDDSDFFYIKYGVLGSASVLYNRQGGGNVRSGLIADAKANMLQQHVLGPNQTYINMSIDVIKTQTGKNGYAGAVYNTTIFTVVVSADVIEYGTAPENYQPNMQSAGLLPTDNSEPTTTPIIQTFPNTNVEVENNKSKGIKYSKGEAVIYTRSNKAYDATIIEINDYNSMSVRIVYQDNGKTKKRWVYIDMLSKK